MMNFDTIVVGAGQAGPFLAAKLVDRGLNVALVEARDLGGTCVNRGCTPTKTLRKSARVAYMARRAAEFGVQVGPVKVDFAVAMQRMQDRVDQARSGLESWLGGLQGLRIIKAHGRLAGRDLVEADDGTRLTAPHIVLATGSHPTRPDVPGAGLGVVSDDFFSWCEAPARVAIIGGGYIAIELAGVLQALGSQVDVFVRDQRLLRQADEALVVQLQDNYRQHGIGLVFGYSLKALHRDDDGRLRLEAEDGSGRPGYDQLMFATGRRPNSDDIGLDSVGIVADANGDIPVDAWQATPAPGVYAIGDLCGCGPTLTPVAIAAGRKLCDRLFGNRPDARLDADNVPSVVFSHPPLAMVGLTEAQARAQHGDNVHIYSSNFRPMREALAESAQRSLFKLVCIGDDRRVVGIHLLGDAADEILQGFAVALKMGATLDDFHDTIAIHPTSAEEVVLMR